MVHEDKNVVKEESAHDNGASLQRFFRRLFLPGRWIITPTLAERVGIVWTASRSLALGGGWAFCWFWSGWARGTDGCSGEVRN